MNERNVAALTALLEKIQDAESDDFAPNAPAWMARCLAAAGVLVPSVLTFEDCTDVVQDWDGDHYFGGPDGQPFGEAGRAHVQQELERIAKGEEP